jgi:hypothetical protein
VLVDQVGNPGHLRASPGRGQFLPRLRTDHLLPAGRQLPEIAQLDAWGTPLSL